MVLVAYDNRYVIYFRQKICAFWKLLQTFYVNKREGIAFSKDKYRGIRLVCQETIGHNIWCLRNAVWHKGL